MVVRTLAEQLESVQSAIEAIEGGAQSYTIENFTYTRGSLKMLYDRETRLLSRIAKQEAGSGRTVAEF